MSTRATIRQRIGRAGFTGDMVTSSATGGAAAGATLLDTTLTYPNDALNNCQVVITSGTAAWDYRWVSDWVQGTGTITPDRAFSAQIAAAVTYELHTKFPATRKNEAIREAMELAGIRWPRIIEDTSLSFLSNTYTYILDSLTVPIDPEYGIDLIEYDTGAAGTGYPYAQLDDDYWRMRNNAGALTLQLDYIPGAVGKTIRLTYRVIPTPLTDDTTTLAPADDRFENYIVAKATALLFEKEAVTSGENDKGVWTSKANYFNQLADGWLPRNEPQKGKVKLAAWGHESGPNTEYTGRIRL